jgi:hypothetical protein
MFAIAGGIAPAAVVGQKARPDTVPLLIIFEPKGIKTTMECFKCHTKMPDGSKFCSNCGKSFQKKDANFNSQDSSKENNATNSGWPRQESIDAFNNIVISRKKTFSKIRRFLWLVILIGSVYFYVTEEKKLQDTVLIISAVLCIAVLFVRPGRLSSGQYYSIPHSKGSDGKHRCIWCGNRGIYKHGEYKTNNTYFDCSKCSAALY